MPFLVKRVSKDGQISWRAQVKIKGYPTLSKSYSRKSDAQKWAQQEEAKIRNGTWVDKREAQRHTFVELVEKYIEEVMPRKPKSAAQQTPQLNWWKKHLGARLLSDVRKTDILALRTKLEKETSASNANRYMAALSHMLNVAVGEWEWLNDSPVKNVKRLPEPRGRVRFLDEDERARLLKSCKESPVRALYPIVLITLSTGARKSEILALEWKPVDLERRPVLWAECGTGIRIHRLKNVRQDFSKISGHNVLSIRDFRSD